MTRPPRFLAAALAVAIASLVLTSLVAWRVDLLGHEEERRDCLRAVAARHDNRVMWLYALDLSDPETPAEERRRDLFEAELDKRLPALECRDGDPVPVDDDERAG